MITKKLITKTVIFSVILSAASMTAVYFALASCPSFTSVDGTTVTFVGELTDRVRDNYTIAWFEYGQTKSYGQKTSEQTLTQRGLYCFTVSNLSPCAIYNYRAVTKNTAGTSYSENKTFITTCNSTTVNIRANGYDSSVTIPYNNSADLSWTSYNTNYCYASGDWSGTKSLSGSQTTGSLTSSKTYTITCTGPSGSISDSVTVNVSTQTYADFSVYETIRNLSDGTAFSDSIYADPNEVLNFRIVVKAGSDSLYNLVVRDTLPSGLVYIGDLRVDNILTSGNILTGLNIGSLSAYQEKTITFRADVAGSESFIFGQTQLTNTVSVTSGSISRSDIASISVTKTAVAGAATAVSTGLTNNIFLDSFFLPLIISLLIIWFFKSRIIKFEEWLDLRKKEYQIYKSKKILQLKIVKIKTRELFQRII